MHQVAAKEPTGLVADKAGRRCARWLAATRQEVLKLNWWVVTFDYAYCPHV
jgi:hypothetical protein